LVFSIGRAKVGKNSSEAHRSLFVFCPDASNAMARANMQLRLGLVG
jgi:hypothetical protein